MNKSVLPQYTPCFAERRNSFVIGLLTSLVFAVVVPCVVMAGLVPSLKAHAPKSPNFRGRPVFNGLGIVWAIWLAAIFLIIYLIHPITTYLNDESLYTLFYNGTSWAAVLKYVLPLLALTVAFGLFDDWAGETGAKGFKGHLSALAHGRLTTGGLKMLGIGTMSLATGFMMFFQGDALSVFQALLAAAVFALSANLMNLFDLRPGRAGKVYLVSLLLIALVWIAMTFFLLLKDFLAGTGNPALGLATRSLLDFLALFLACLGPIIATWRFDMGEAGMQGDAGANTMGAMLGFMAVLTLRGMQDLFPAMASSAGSMDTRGLFFLLMLALLAAALLVVNLLSERLSFSRIIEKTVWLKRLDELGLQKNRSDKSEGIDKLDVTDETDEMEQNK